MARSGWSLAPDEDAADMYLCGLERLEAAGYAHYEISNVAKPGRESRHNLKYWTDGEWLGFGCGAHSTRHGARWKNLSATAEYVERVQRGEDVAVERRELTWDERLEEALFMGLRLVDGVDIEDVGRRYRVDVWARYGDRLQPFVDDGLVRREGSRIRLARDGMLVANEIMSVFV
jgi:oxygen-independent coproporphyrinogen-3 oxidase